MSVKSRSSSSSSLILIVKSRSTSSSLILLVNLVLENLYSYVLTPITSSTSNLLMNCYNVNRNASNTINIACNIINSASNPSKVRLLVKLHENAKILNQNNYKIQKKDNHSFAHLKSRKNDDNVSSVFKLPCT